MEKIIMTNKYFKLLQEFPPRTITNEEQLDATQEVIDRLLDKGELNQE